MKIYKTKNYAQFQSLLGNRVLGAGHINRLIKSINEQNLLEYVPILVNEKMEVIDGQHRLTVAERLDIPIHYVQVRGFGLDQALILNANLRNWVMADYLESYISQGYEDYAYAKKFSRKHGVTLSNTVAMLGADWEEPIFRMSPTQFREGLFEIVDKQKATEFVKFIKRIAPFTLAERTEGDRDFIHALYKIHLSGEATLEEVVESLEKYPHKIYQTNLLGYIRQFEDAVNHGRHNKIRLY